MDGIELLRALIGHRTEAGEGGGLDPAALRFVVEYDRTEPSSDADRRTAIAELLGTESFDFLPLFDEDEIDVDDDEFGEFRVLQFPGLEPTMDNQALFTVANDLQRALDVVTVEPDLGSELFREPAEPGAEVESVGDAFGRLCFVEGAAPDDLEWALAAIKVPGAWSLLHEPGAGIRIAQPDTGVSVHDELSDVRFDPDHGYDILSGRPGATDPLGRGGNPGHGTGTASVAVSGPGGRIRGSAPYATLVPIRCIESVVIKFNAGPVARAIDHARQQHCHVITMSLGGSWSRAVKKAVKRAVRSDMIVLAAAGNCVRLVVYPARLDEVIAVAGCNVDDEPWRGSSRGGAVDITAPAEKVWKAVAGNDRAAIGGGQGTSFAVALTAGVAALWLSHHSPAAVSRAARATGTTVQDLFRDLLKRTARRPPGWNSDDFGAGIVDAEALLRMALPTGAARIESVARRSPPGADTLRLLTEALDPGDVAALADVVTTSPQFELELNTLVLDDRRLEADARLGPESNALREPVSPQLAAALEHSGRSGLDRRPRRRMTAPPRVGSPPIDDPVVLVASAGRRLESTGSVSKEEAVETLRARSDEHLGRLEARIVRARDVADGADPRLTSLGDQLLTDTEDVLARLRDGEPLPADPGRRTALEALVALEGRPSIRLSDDGVDPNDPELGDWQGAVLLADDFDTLQRSVGRIDGTAGVHDGTGFVVGPGLVMTNRHVLEALAIPTPSATDPADWVMPGDPTINFSANATDPTQQFRVTGIEMSGADPIAGRLEHAHLDMAVLRVEETNQHGRELPAALPFDAGPSLLGQAQVFVVGYPARPTVLPNDDEGRVRMDVVERLRTIFGSAYGVRYLSPGVVATPAAMLPESPRHWMFTHDATSLGGNSGSCVLALDRQLAVAGLHVAGDWLRANYAHSIVDVIAERQVLW